MLAAETQSAIQPLIERLGEARRQSDSFFDIVRPESIFDRPIPERHRIIFYVGHLEAFDWNLLHDVLKTSSFHPEFDRLFAFGIDPVGGGLPTDQPSDWPSLSAVREYVQGVRARIDDKLGADLDAVASGRDGFGLDTLLNVAIEHRLMHLETLAYMFHQLPFATKIKPLSSIVRTTSSISPSMIQIPAGPATLGISRTGTTFGWDNEFESHSVQVAKFDIDKYMVTNGQFLEFMKAGGYETPSFWSEEDWHWKTANAIGRPVFWRDSGDLLLYRTMFEEIDLPLNWPVYVSHAEASAYARWAGKVLPTEQQWHRAAYGTSNDEQRFYPWGTHSPTKERGNFDFQSWDPAPVNAHPDGASAFGVEGMIGNGWEWTSTPFGPYPGFQVFPFYRGYSADFFDGKHFVMKGGSPRTAACMLRSTFRNWFQAHYQYVYAGFRCVNT
jgi:gamma-glutamyl hercynylcysteine S-oxide synthase